EAALGLHHRPEVAPAGMLPQVNVLPIVEPGAPYICLVHREAERTDQVQRRVGRRAEAGDVAGVRRYLGLDEGDVHYGPVGGWADRRVNAATCINERRGRLVDGPGTNSDDFRLTFPARAALPAPTDSPPRRPRAPA